ncbi:metal-sulfur cluster assembly factor [Halapricum hydrolyticum]|uniref:Iron-sulfur cluster assembly protein n=1 Tax=Halapricum hydrolyticum TaxID=2979991 RepID=A0AAE3IEG8_9EURY|nr:iron-sulfur cluster assembly protein [Halapricum hydrolyticum]MCU4718799.1 iron-sulfur cluster assembly protein [Halapricum hydrolyticum]MCU4727793.1 iron-sulfur cluster assembly protein [Halapricum hydrolyticum]
MVERAAVVEALRGVHDPEIPVNVYDLGLVYEIEIAEDVVDIEMTLTSTTCPIAGQMVEQAENAVRAVEGVKEATVELVWDPPWSPEMATDEGKMKLQSIGVSVPDSSGDSDGDDDSHSAEQSPF